MPKANRKSQTKTQAKPKRAAKKPAAVVPPKPEENKAKPEPAQPLQGLKIVYPEMEVIEFSTTSAAGPLTAEKCAIALRWETEKQHQDRMIEEKPGTKPELWAFKDEFHCKNNAGEKVRCWANAGNRPFDEQWSRALTHTILSGQWAGPFTIPGETVNGETARISKYGRVISAQHSMTACVIANEILQDTREKMGREFADEKYPVWAGQDQCFIETIVVRGMSEDQRVLMTVDYVKPRTAADVFYTSEVFKNATDGERKELCRILASAVDCLWSRTDTRGYKTHPEMVAFLERHKKLLDCVLHIFSENSRESNRRLSKLRLSPGVCAALLFIMGSSGPKTNGDDYRNEEPAPSQKKLDWVYEDKANEFWSLLASARDFMPVRTALNKLTDSSAGDESNQGLGGRGPEKLAILAKAWEHYRDYSGPIDQVFSLEDLEPGGLLCLSYTTLDPKGDKLPEGEISLIDGNDFYGIDCPETVGGVQTGPPMPPAPTPEEIDAMREQNRANRSNKA